MSRFALIKVTLTVTLIIFALSSEEVQELLQTVF